MRNPLHTWLSVLWTIERHLSAELAPRARLLEGRLLDVGCGGSPYREFCGSARAYFGIDHPTSMVSPTPLWTRQLQFLSAWARRRKPAAASVTPGPTLVGDALALPLLQSSVDSVLSTQFLEHCPEPWRALEEIARVLVPGGRLLLSAPQTWSLHEEPRDYYRFTKYGLTTLLESAGFEVEEIVPLGGYWAAASQMLSVYLSESFVRGVVSLFPIAMCCAMVQRIGWLLDRLHPRSEHTLGWVVMATKRRARGASPLPR